MKLSMVFLHCHNVGCICILLYPIWRKRQETIYVQTESRRMQLLCIRRLKRDVIARNLRFAAAGAGGELLAHFDLEHALAHAQVLG
ncbi:MAG: hypothetical protein Q4A66_12865, partial [Eubacteriales bacterium]|nr:hypothetical protein [Eubacteriales bacterium]